MQLVQLNECATITICHIFSKNVKENLSNRILLISVTGKANLTTADYLIEQAVVIDIGICCKVGITENVAFDEACKKANYITAVQVELVLRLQLCWQKCIKIC